MKTKSKDISVEAIVREVCDQVEGNWVEGWIINVIETLDLVLLTGFGVLKWKLAAFLWCTSIRQAIKSLY